MKRRNARAMKCKRYVSEVKKSISEKKNIKGCKEIANQILKELKITEVPIPIIKILKSLDFNIYVDDLQDKNISGFLMISPDLQEKFETDRIAVIEETDTYGRQRFTLAHEFAHYIFDFDENSSSNFFLSTYDLERSNVPEEILASRFAAELLMPEKIFKKDFKNLEKKTMYEKIKILTEQYQVSSKAVSKRIEELELLPNRLQQ